MKYLDLSGEGVFADLQKAGRAVLVGESKWERAVLTFSHSGTPKVVIERLSEDLLGDPQWLRVKDSAALYELDFEGISKLLAADAVATGGVQASNSPGHVLVPKGSKGSRGVAWWMGLGPWGLLGVSEPLDEGSTEHIFEVTSSRVFRALDLSNPLEAAHAHFLGVSWALYRGKTPPWEAVVLTLSVLALCGVPGVVSRPPARSGPVVLLH